MSSNIRVIRRGDGARITQGRSFVLLGPNELDALIRDLTVVRDGSPRRAETVTRLEDPI